MQKLTGRHFWMFLSLPDRLLRCHGRGPQTLEPRRSRWRPRTRIGGRIPRPLAGPHSPRSSFPQCFPEPKIGRCCNLR
jgi:hypothetical protein